MRNERAEFERWFKNHYHAGNQPSGKGIDARLSKVEAGSANPAA